MALKNSKYEYLYDEYMNVDSIDLFSQAERRVKKKKEDLEDMHNEFDLLENQAFMLYKEHVYYPILDSKSMFDDAKKWLECINKGVDENGLKIDRRKKYGKEQIFSYLISHLCELLGIDDIKIDSFIDYNFGEANEIIFLYRGHKWQLTIPCVKKVPIKSYKSYGAYCFKIRLCHYDSPYMTSVFGSTFIEEELADIMKAGIEKYCSDNT